MTKSNWPTREDGSNKTMGEMTPAERREQWEAAVARFKERFASQSQTGDAA